jgi:prolyl-tRNA editing enzyme YbaK/EbsC (Cys-tRNA(Pro) deacylase)
MSLSTSAMKVQKALDQHGLSLQVVELPASTRTAVEAAQAIGCSVGQIVKSLVFRGQQSGKPVLVLASGPNRVDVQKVAAIFGEPVGKADAEYVRQHTGFVIGGVPPAGHDEPIPTFIDTDLEQYSEIWAAAGTPNAVFRLTPQELVQISKGIVAKVAVDDLAVS